MEKKDRIDLYNTLQSKTDLEQKEPITRFLYVVQLTDERGQRLDMEKYFLNWVSANQGDLVTGYMMVRDIVILHMIEGSNEVVTKYAEHLYQEFNKEKPAFSVVNIVAFTDENVERCYKTFLSEQVFQGLQTVTETDRAETQISEKNWQIYSQFCDAGKKLQQNPNLKPATEIQINNEDLCMLLLKRFMNINEYHELYLADLEIDFEQEKLFPYAPNITNILEFSENGFFSKFVNASE